jgi:Protein of unknown function (DUF3107)
VEIKIGIQSVPREIVLETADSAQDVEAALSEAVAAGTVLVLRDDKGGKVLVPADKIAYMEISSGAPRRVGFGTL